MRELADLSESEITKRRFKRSPHPAQRKQVLKEEAYEPVNWQTLHDEDIMDESLNLVVARNPFARLVSGYYCISK